MNREMRGAIKGAKIGGIVAIGVAILAGIGMTLYSLFGAPVTLVYILAIMCVCYGAFFGSMVK